MDASAWIALVAGIVGSGGLSALGGYLLAGRNEEKRDERAAERDQESLRERQADNGRVFQRDTLLELHDLLYRLNRNVGKAGHVDEMRYRKDGQFRRELLPDELSDDFTELVTSINRLRVRIFDPGLRDAVDQYTKTVISAGMCSGQRKAGDDGAQHARAERIEREALDQYGKLEEMLGADIRSQFPGSDLTPLALPAPGAIVSPPARPSRRRLFRRQ